MTRARELADLLTGGQTITTADNTTQLTLSSTDADASVGPVLDLVRDSSSPADNDLTGSLVFKADDAAGNATEFVKILTQSQTVANGSEDGRIQMSVMKGGTARNVLDFTNTEVVFNEDSVDLDFRVESNGNANMLVVDGGNDRVGIGTSSPQVALHVDDSSSSGKLRLSKGTVSAADDGIGSIQFRAGNTTAAANINGRTDASGTANGALQFSTGTTSSLNERMRIVSDGRIYFQKTDENAQSDGFEFHPSAGIVSTGSAAVVGVFNRKTNDGTIVQFRQDNTTEGTITVSGSTVSYNGGHLARWSQATDGNRIDGLVKGTVMTNLNQMAVWHHEAQAATYYKEGDELPEGVSVGDEKTAAVAAYDEDNEQLNCMAVSSVEGDANVAGVFVNWDDDDDEFTADMNVAMTGDMVIRIAQGTTVERGDLLMSAGDGTAKPQDDDIVRSKTIAKVTSTTKSHTYDDGSYLVPCVLMAC